MMRGLWVLVLISTAPCIAQADEATETQLRAALQQATSQIADLENQVANLQAAQAPDTAMIEALKAQVMTLQKSGGAAAPGAAPNAKPANDSQVAALRHELAARQAALGKSQAAYIAAAAAADAKTAANAQLTSQLGALNKRLNTCDASNAVLFKLGNQILDAYAHKDDLFGAIVHREPFIGFSRVQLETEVQADQQTMLDNQIAPAQTGH
jgi:chromosome segregation ATPase